MKSKLTKKEINAVKQSVKHWKEDIQSRLIKGDTIYEDRRDETLLRLRWKSDNKKEGYLEVIGR